MNEWLCIRCPIGIPQERRASMMSPTAPMRPHATAALWFKAHLRAISDFADVLGLQSQAQPQAQAQAQLVLFFHFHFHFHSLTITIIVVVVSMWLDDVIFIIITHIGSAHFVYQIPCRSSEAPIADTTMQNDITHHPTNSNSSDLNKAKSDQNAARSDIENANPNAPLNEKHENVENANCISVNGIVSSPDNPATIRRLSQDDSTNTVSWHKRVVVHRVPRSDASRSMFVSSSQSKEGLSSQCCVIV